MANGFRAQHVASFFEHYGKLSSDDIVHNLEALSNEGNLKPLDCFLRIVNGEYLSVRGDIEREPLERFDLCYIDDPHSYSWTSEGAEYPHLLVFRFLSRETTKGKLPNEVHIFSLKDERKLESVIDVIDEAVDKAQKTNKHQYMSRQKPTRTISRRKDATKRPERLKRNIRQQSIGGTKGKLVELNQLFDEIENFESRLYDAVSFQITDGRKINRTIWRNILNPPPYETVTAHVERIRKCINMASEIQEHSKDPGPGEVLNRLFESVNWVQKICDGKRFPLYDPDLVRSVSRPVFTEKTIRTLSDHLQAGNRSLWQSLGPAWTMPSGRSNTIDGDLTTSTGTAGTKRSGFKPKMTIKDYGYYSKWNGGRKEDRNH
ncbi:hypothetical protein Aperf_G00000092526 [Anoplocephala perfoliata]